MIRPAPATAMGDGRGPRRISCRWLGAGVVLSVLLHVIVIAPLMLGLVELGKLHPLDEAVVVELVVLEAPALQEESIAEPPPEPEAERLPEPEPAQAAEVEPFREPPEAPEAEPETAEAPAPEPERAEALDVEPPAEPQEASEAEPAEPELVEEIPEAPMPQPEPAEPAPLQEQVVESAPSTLPESEPSVALPPRPPRKPVLAELSSEPPVEARPVEKNTAQTAAPPPVSDYRTTKEIAEVSREQLLANLAVARDEAAQAEANPELWRVIRAVRAQVEGCWLISPAEARNPKLSVDIDVAFDRGGQVTKAQVREIGRMVVDDEFKAFATTAHGALKACGPFKLPPESYAIWRSFTMRFVPRQRS